MRTLLTLALTAPLLVACSPAVSDVVSAPPRSAMDTSVLVADAENLVIATLDLYIDRTNQIMNGADSSLIEQVTTAEWAIEEQNGFRAVDALGGATPSAGITRFEVMSVRGRHTLVDAYVAACISGSLEPMRVSIRMVPRDSFLVIAEISPWEDSTWCAPLSSL